MSDIFLSYAKGDRDRVRPLVAALEAMGWSVFWDPIIPTGKTWRQIIKQEIRSCRAVVVVWSRKSVESIWVQEEAEEGKRRDVLLPVLLDEVDPPFGFASIQAADMTRWDGSSEAPVLRSLVRDILRGSGDAGASASGPSTPPFECPPGEGSGGEPDGGEGGGRASRGGRRPDSRVHHG